MLIHDVQEKVVILRGFLLSLSQTPGSGFSMFQKLPIQPRQLLSHHSGTWTFQYWFPKPSAYLIPCFLPSSCGGTIYCTLLLYSCPCIALQMTPGKIHYKNRASLSPLELILGTTGTRLHLYKTLFHLLALQQTLTVPALQLSFKYCFFFIQLFAQHLLTTLMCFLFSLLSKEDTKSSRVF